MLKFFKLMGVAAIAVPLASAADFNWRGRLAAGQTIEIKGVNGFVRAERASGNEVEIAAVKSHGDTSTVQVVAIDNGHGMTVCAVYPSSESGHPNECRPGSGGRMSVHNNAVRVDFTLRVPAGVNFTGRTVNGDIEATSLAGNVEAWTVNGKVHISTSGNALAHTVNGSISASLGATRSEKPLEFETVNGGITLDLPAGISARVEAATVNGHISTDFPLTIKGGFSGKHITGFIGQGGAELSLKTVNGSIELRRT